MELVMDKVLNEKAKGILREKLSNKENVMVYGQTGDGRTEFLKWVAANIPEDKTAVVLGLSDEVKSNFSGLGSNVTVIQYGWEEDTEKLVNGLGVDYVIYEELAKYNNLLNLNNGIGVVASYTQLSVWETDTRLFNMYRSWLESRGEKEEDIKGKVNELYGTRVDMKGVNVEYLSEILAKENGEVVIGKVRVGEELTEGLKEELKEELNKEGFLIVVGSGKESYKEVRNYIREHYKGKSIKNWEKSRKEGNELLGGNWVISMKKIEQGKSVGILY